MAAETMNENDARSRRAAPIGDFNKTGHLNMNSADPSNN
jgi:hypothetical protein